MIWLQTLILPVAAVAVPVSVRNRCALEAVSNYYDHFHTQT